MLLLLIFVVSAFAQSPTKLETLAAMKKAAAFYKEKVATHGGYHFAYTDDLSYGRSESSETPNRVELQRDGTPRVGMAYLEAFHATGDTFYLEAARSVAHTLVRGQLCSGGWDYWIEFDPQQRRRFPYRADGNCESPKIRGASSTTFDDNVSQANLRFLMRTDRELRFQDAAIHEAAQFALESFIKAQYPNGAWPQRYSEFPDPANYPVKKASYPASWSRQWPGENYRQHYTFNDNSIADCIDMMLEAGRIYNEPKYLASAEKGGQFILLAQMPEPQPAWAQQYDLDMHPAWARVFEPPSVTGGESQGILRMLMVLYRETGNRKYLEPVPRALDYLKRSILPPVENPSEVRRRVGPGPVLARFYELQTNRPLYITKGTTVSVKGFPSLRTDGYELSYSDESVITHYGVLVSARALPEIEQEYRKVATEDPARLRRPDRLRGLSPWSESQQRPPVTPQQARAILDSMDARGAWVEEGVIGKADRLFQVFAAKPMLLMVNRKPIQISENDTVELFLGSQPPRTRILRSTTFAANLEALAAYVAALP
ncbi:MAG: pectate lyase [Bryobacteraceae bacterium]|nr:pectate lyase [Bryobacteraceae bacterium]MDW8377089.1 pectate lyase [Bryobacterales bacterium]